MPYSYKKSPPPSFKKEYPPLAKELGQIFKPPYYVNETGIPPLSQEEKIRRMTEDTMPDWEKNPPEYKDILPQYNIPQEPSAIPLFDEKSQQSPQMYIDREGNIVGEGEEKLTERDYPSIKKLMTILESLYGKRI